MNKSFINLCLAGILTVIVVGAIILAKFILQVPSREEYRQAMSHIRSTTNNLTAESQKFLSEIGNAEDKKRNKTCGK